MALPPLFPVQVSGSLDTDWISVGVQVTSVLLAGIIGYASAVLLEKRATFARAAAEARSALALIKIELAQMIFHLEAIMGRHPGNNYVASTELQGTDALWQIYATFIKEIANLKSPQSECLVKTYTTIIALEKRAKSNGSVPKDELASALQKAIKCQSLIVK